jgi:hypothetical protein
MAKSEMILNLVPRKKKGGRRTSAVEEIRLQNYSVLFLELRLGGGVAKRHWYGGIAFYRLGRRRVVLALAAIVTLAENRCQQ